MEELRLALMKVKDEGGESFCANKFWYVRVEPRVIELVGERARSEDPVLRSAQAQKLAYSTLYKLLPNCRNCACVGW
jgi:hypothetical protein